MRETRDLRSCAYVVLWDTASRGLWRLGSSTTSICTEGPSTGSGISQVATSGRRVFWVTFAGGNVREETLWTATPTRRAPRRLADAAGDVDAGLSRIVLGPGSTEGVAYAVGSTVTYVSESGARLFRATLDSPVRLLSSGTTYGAGRVLAALADGRVVLLSGRGTVVDTDPFEPGTVRAISLATAGQVVQGGRNVYVGPSSGRVAAVRLPAASMLLDYRQRAIVYRLGTEVRVRHVATGADRLLRVIPVRSWQPMLFSTDSWGAAWAIGASVSWRSGPLS